MHYVHHTIRTANCKQQTHLAVASLHGESLRLEQRHVHAPQVEVAARVQPQRDLLLDLERVVVLQTGRLWMVRVVLLNMNECYYTHY